MQEISLITSRLEACDISYCIVGGIASIAYGRPRLTLDADLVVALLPHQLESLVKAFPAEDFYLPPQEVLLAEMQRESRGHFNILHQHSALRADCYLPGKDPLAHWELRNRRRLDGPFGNCWFSPPEAVIINKLLFFREGQSQKHIEDIRAMRHSVTDADQLAQWIKAYGLQKEWQIVLSEATDLQ